MFIAILGRQPEISIAELEAVYGDKNIQRVSNQAALVDCDTFAIDTLGGITKCGYIIKRVKSQKSDHTALLQASKFITEQYTRKLAHSQKKITFGISFYDGKANPRDIQKIGLILKKSLKKANVSLRLIPNKTAALSTATSHNNKLGRSETKIEIIIVKATNSDLLIAESRGTQNINSYTQRDRGRPKRDAFVGMLPPKLAQIMINLSGAKSGDYLWDPFCGTGTVLQEAALARINTYGSDLSDKMINYTSENMHWLEKTFSTDTFWQTFQSDATSIKLTPEQKQQISHIVCETYLGQPFSTPPAPEKLQEVARNCNHITNSFLQNIRSQIRPDSTLCIAVPAWQNHHGQFTHLPLLKNLNDLGYRQITNKNLLYYRPDQVVGREILVLKPIDIAKTA